MMVKALGLNHFVTKVARHQLVKIRPERVQIPPLPANKGRPLSVRAPNADSPGSERPRAEPSSDHAPETLGPLGADQSR